MQTGAIHIRTADARDAERIGRVQIHTWHSTYKGIVPDSYLHSMTLETNAARWMRILEEESAIADGGRFTIVAVEGANSDGGNVAGFASAGPERDGMGGFDAEIYAIYVAPGLQNRGIGRRLMREAALRLLTAGYASMLVWVLAENPNREFYRKLGGMEIGRKDVRIGGRLLEETAFGWMDIGRI